MDAAPGRISEPLGTIEKLAPWLRAATEATATPLVSVSVGILGAPQTVPAPVIPGWQGATTAMKAIQ
jgi:NaMN:DMB phosphoribosyltransferase